MSVLETTINAIEPRCQGFYQQAEAAIAAMNPSLQALGRVLEVSKDLAAMRRSLTPSVERKKIVVMAGDHGIATHGVSRYPKDVTVQLIKAINAGVSGSAVLARQAGAELHAVDVGVDADLSTLISSRIHHCKIAYGTNDFLNDQAMTREQAVSAVEVGISVAGRLAPETDLFATGDKGIGNTSPSSAIVATLCDVPVSVVTGRGTGLDDQQLTNKIAVLERALQLHQPDRNDPIGVLSKVGGYDIAGIAGLILGAAALRRPVIVDGFISTAGALIAAELAPACRDYLIAAHLSVEYGHQIALQKLDKRPLLELDFRLGEGTGAAVAMNIVQAAASVLDNERVFKGAGLREVA